MIRLVEWVREDGLSNPPSAKSAHTVPHAGDHEKTVKVIDTIVRLCQIAMSVRVQSGKIRACGHSGALTYLRLVSWSIRGYETPLKGQRVSPVARKNTRVSKY